MTLIDWYLVTLYENGIKTAWVRNAQQVDDQAEESPPLGRDYFYANLSQTQTARLKFVKRTGESQAYDIPPNTPERAVQVPATYENYAGSYQLFWI